jgi:hypothetical protein
MSHTCNTNEVSPFDAGQYDPEFDKTLVTLKLERPYAQFIMEVLGRVADAMQTTPLSTELNFEAPHATHVDVDYVEIRNLASKLWYELNPLPEMGELIEAEKRNLDLVDHGEA